MRERQKTTVYLDPEDYARLKVIARQSGQKPAALVREAVAEYTQRRSPSRLPQSVGMGRSGLRDLGQRADDYLKGFGQDG